MEIASGYEEIERLLAMTVLREPNQDELERGTPLSTRGTPLCTRSVYDWRFRDRKWKRRCRFVAREFRSGDRGDALTFAPTSGIGGKLVMLLHGWTLSFLDIKDAFLLVPQQEWVLVARPSWWDPSSTPGNCSGKICCLLDGPPADPQLREHSFVAKFVQTQGEEHRGMFSCG